MIGFDVKPAEVGSIGEEIKGRFCVNYLLSAGRLPGDNGLVVFEVLDVHAYFRTIWSQLFVQVSGDGVCDSPRL
jgi:hypothetical protein